VSRGADLVTGFIGINWGSSNFRAYRVAADGALIDKVAEPAGIASLDRPGMARQVAKLAERWPDSGPIYASGMVGSNVGWVDVPYAACPAGLADVAAAAVETRFGDTVVTIVPGLTCHREADGGVDILRGEETEMFGLVALEGITDGVVALPGTHTKWVRIRQGRAVDFLTSMSGEIFDRLTAQGLLASIVEGEASDGEIFRHAVDQAGARRLGLGSLLFGIRARVIRGELQRADAASALRGLLIGSDIGDALAMFPTLGDAVIPLVGNGALSQLYAAALSSLNIATRLIDADQASAAGFRVFHRAATPRTR
jgi:2-dehydro-3-deoxygalactonokinase